MRFPKITIQYGRALQWDRVEDPTREQQRAVADAVLTEIRALYDGLQTHGRKGVLQRVRAQRRAKAGCAKRRRGSLSDAHVCTEPYRGVRNDGRRRLDPATRRGKTVSSSIELGAVIRKVFRIYVDQASVLMPAAAVVFVITGVLSELLISSKSAGLALLVLVVDLIATTLFTGMVVELVADIQDGRRDASPTQLLRAVTPVLGELILVGIVTGVLEAIGFLLILIPGLILMTIWSVVAPVVVIEASRWPARPRPQPRARTRRRLARCSA